MSVCTGEEEDAAWLISEIVPRITVNLFVLRVSNGAVDYEEGKSGSCQVLRTLPDLLPAWLP
jgi:hypothetical protein